MILPSSPGCNTEQELEDVFGSTLSLSDCDSDDQEVPQGSPRQRLVPTPHGTRRTPKHPLWRQHSFEGSS
ncbi:hypothetical protein WJX72_002548 [[Myrmecia] bisecta]|uniref:Uncharacterized protein n=1 Tax=[Myrmecia] bisecta TaxID=41462 RepID=A0AAW1PSK9_9CHLO